MATAAEVWRMRAATARMGARPALPPGYALASWRDDDAPCVHALLVEAYRNGGGTVDADAAAWRAWFTSDAAFDPAACFLARAPDGGLAAAALCWSSAYLKDLCVATVHRRRGLGEALLRHAAAAFAARGAPFLELKVESDNPSGAVRLYERLGFEVVERIPA